MTLSRVIEALLFGAQKPLSVRELTEAIRRPAPRMNFRLTSLRGYARQRLPPHWSN